MIRDKISLEGFAECKVETAGTYLYARKAGAGPPLLLLHGFPETHLMWRDVAPILSRYFTVVCADLRGYGHSGCPPSSADHYPYSKRVMGEDMVQLMAKMGFEKFMVAGHDRGGRVAYRMALDQPEKILKVAVLDIVPTAAAWDYADSRLTLGFWPWSLLAQPAPLPEKLIGAAPYAVIENAMAQWGSNANTFPDVIKKAYVDALSDPEHIHAICEEYRAAAGIDREQDAKDVKLGRRIACPLLALWSSEGSLATWYTDIGGPLELWLKFAITVQGKAVRGGHFFPEENPEETAVSLIEFFGGQPAS